MDNFLSFIIDNIVIFDVILFIFIFYFALQSLSKGFVLSLVSSLKWILALVITIKLIPLVESQVSNYIDVNERVFSIGLSIFVYAVSLFVLIVIGKSLGKLSYAGVGTVDKIFGFFFGILKGYIFAVCIFAIVNWFYSYEKWDMSLDNSYFFPKVEWGSKILIDNFPGEKDFENTKEKIEKI
tara:strand:+ start:24019 stop:24564 length:546 start_codon:yes stop_codon:yes gene_type:complete